MKKTALITGGAGFIGSHLAEELLQRDYRVIALDNLSTGSRQNVAHLLTARDFELVIGSALDEDLVNRLVAASDLVFHLAAAVGVQLIIDKPLESFINNIKSCEIVFQACAELQKKILFTSSSEIYGRL